MKTRLPNGAYKISRSQLGILVSSLSSKESGIFVQQRLMTLKESLNVSAFHQAWLRLMERHDVLRSSFHWDEVSPHQLPHSQVELEFEKHDGRHLQTHEKAKQLEDYIRADARRGFELTRPPLMRVAVFHMEENHYEVVWTYHHVMIDGRSILILLDELFAFYEALCEKRELTLPPPRPFREFIHWISEQKEPSGQLFWEETLKGFRTPNALSSLISAFEPKESDNAIAGNMASYQFPSSLSNSLKQLATESETTVATLFQAAWAVLLSRYSGEKDVVFGSVRAGRKGTVEGAEKMVGLFVNTVPLRVNVTEQQSIIELLKQLRKYNLRLRPHEHMPLSEIQKYSAVPSSLPLFQSLVMYDHLSLDAHFAQRGGNWKNRRFFLRQRLGYPINFIATGGTDLSLWYAYDHNKFNRLTMDRISGHVRTVLEGMVANPHQNISDLPWLTTAEKKQVVVEWNDTAKTYSDNKCLHDLFEEQARKNPQNVALVFRGKNISYGELKARVDSLSSQLVEMEVGNGVKVGVYLSRSPEMIVAVLAIVKAGGAYVPLDVSYPKDRIQFMLEDTKA